MRSTGRSAANWRWLHCCPRRTGADTSRSTSAPLIQSEPARERDDFWLNLAPAESLHLSRLRGSTGRLWRPSLRDAEAELRLWRSKSAAGGGTLSTRAV